MERFLLFVALGGILSPGQGAPAAGSLTGRVVDGTTKEGVRRATVYATAQGGSAPQGAGARAQAPTSYSAVTDDAGQYRFPGLAPGVYGLMAERTGYMPAPAARGTGAKVAAGEEAGVADIVLWRQGIITGRVTDAEGDPVEHASVWAVPAGRGRAMNMRQGVTDDRGEFRLSRLAAGPYKVLAMRQGSGGATPVVAAGEGTTLYAPTFFPSTLEMASATEVLVGRGEERGGVEIRLQRTPAVRVSGRVTGEWPAEAQVSLVLQPYEAGEGRGALEMLNGIRARTAMADSGGRFVFPNVTAGEYVLSAGVYRATGSLSGAVRVRVGQQEVENLGVTVNPLVRVTGRVVAEGGGKVPVGGLTLSVRGTEPWVPAGGSARVADDGTFSFANLQRTRFRVNSAAPRGWYLKAVSVGGQRQAGLEFDVTGGDAMVELIYSNRPGTVTGTVEGAGEGVRVAAVPDGGAGVPGFANLYRTGAVEAGQNGFKIEDVPPGNYVLIACLPAHLEAVSDPAIWERVKGKTVTVKVEEGGTVTGTPRLISESDIDEK